MTRKFEPLIFHSRKANVLRLWNYLLELLRARRMRLELCLQLQQNFQEMLYILDSMDELKMRLQSEDFGVYSQSPKIVVYEGLVFIKRV